MAADLVPGPEADPPSRGAGWLAAALLVAVRRGPGRADLLTALSLLLIGTSLVAADLGELFGRGPALLEAARWWHLVPLGAGCVLVLAKRRRPVLALVAGAVLVAAEGVLLGFALGTYLVLADLLFGVETWAGPRTRRVVRLVLAAAVLGAATTALLVTGDARLVLMVVVQAGALLGVPIWWARDLRRSTELTALERQRADLRRRRDRDALRLLALDRDRSLREQRAATARDLHDTVTSHLSAVAIHAAAGLGDDADERAALQQVRRSSLAALQEMRRMIEVLRDGSPGTDGGPGLVRLPELVEDTRAAGLDVVVAGEAAVGLPPAVDEAAYRIVAEALTNAAKHAPGGRVMVHLDTDGPVHVQVRSRPACTQGRADAAVVPWPDGPGHGLATMMERARAVGGTVTAGPLPDGTWQVDASLPAAP